LFQPLNLSSRTGPEESARSNIVAWKQCLAFARIWNVHAHPRVFRAHQTDRGRKMYFAGTFLVVVLTLLSGPCLAQGCLPVHSAMAEECMSNVEVMQESAHVNASALLQEIAISNPSAGRKPISQARREWSDRFLACNAPMRACMANCEMRAQRAGLTEKFFLRCLNRLCDKYLVASCFQHAGPLPP
jgi:hypothetical protein